MKSRDLNNLNIVEIDTKLEENEDCLLYTSDAADE